MRILMTTDTVGGVWTFTTTLTEQLLQRGHEVCLVSFGRLPSPSQQAWADHHSAAYARAPLPRATYSEAAETLSYSASSGDKECPGAFTYTSTEIPLEWMQNNKTAFTEGQRILLHTIQQRTPDLILSNQFCFGALETPVPSIIAAHSDVLSWAQACRRTALDASPWLSRYTSIVQAGLRKAQAVTAPTFTMAKALVDHFTVPHGVEVIANGASVPDVDLGFELSGPTAPTERKLQAITAGRLWDEGKGLDALRDLQSPVPILLAGDNVFESTNTQTISPFHVTNVGSLSQADLHLLFRQSAIYLCTSYYEPFGLAVLEAALCGCALLCRDIPSLREVWQESALFFTDQQSLQRLLQQLAADHGLLNAYQARAIARAREFNPERMTDSYLDLFRSVLRKHEAKLHVA